MQQRQAAQFIAEMIPSICALEERRPAEYDAAHVPGETEDGA
jgi:hypothetical protein